jgi:hypothetical protein
MALHSKAFKSLLFFCLFLASCSEPSLRNSDIILETDQDLIVYFTPYGKKYHTAECRMVDNTSNGISIAEAIQKGLTPCSFCKPKSSINNSQGNLSENLEQKPGQKSESTQCLGITKKGNRCMHTTKNANGYCFQHLPQAKE